jgi:hypothetical protein
MMVRAAESADSTSLEYSTPTAMVGDLGQVALCTNAEMFSTAYGSALIGAAHPVIRESVGLYKSAARAPMWQRGFANAATMILAVIPPPAEATQPTVEIMGAQMLSVGASRSAAHDIVVAVARSGRVLAESVSEASDHAFDVFLAESVLSKKKTIVSKRR